MKWSINNDPWRVKRPCWFKPKILGCCKNCRGFPPIIYKLWIPLFDAMFYYNGVYSIQNIGKYSWIYIKNIKHWKVGDAKNINHWYEMNIICYQNILRWTKVIVRQVLGGPVSSAPNTNRDVSGSRVPINRFGYPNSNFGSGNRNIAL